MKSITVVSLGPGSRDHLTLGTIEALKKAEKVILRTRVRCDAADYLAEIGVCFETLDYLHEECEDFEELKQRAAEKVVEAAQEHAVCYAVFDASAEPWLLDVCLIYCLISFLAVVLLAKIKISEKQKGEDPDAPQEDPAKRRAKEVRP